MVTRFNDNEFNSGQAKILIQLRELLNMGPHALCLYIILQIGTIKISNIDAFVQIEFTMYHIGSKSSYSCYFIPNKSVFSEKKIQVLLPQNTLQKISFEPQKFPKEFWY